MQLNFYYALKGKWLLSMVAELQTNFFDHIS